jgi:hypothetical protein
MFLLALKGGVHVMGALSRCRWEDRRAPPASALAVAWGSETRCFRWSAGMFGRPLHERSRGRLALGDSLLSSRDSLIFRAGWSSLIPRTSCCDWIQYFLCKAPSLTRGWVCNLQCNGASSISSYIATDGLSASSSWCQILMS